MNVCDFKHLDIILIVAMLCISTMWGNYVQHRWPVPSDNAPIFSFKRYKKRTK